MSKNNRFNPIVYIAYLYIFLPVLLFLLTWIKPIIGIPFFVLVAFGIYQSLKNETPVWTPSFSKRSVVYLCVGIGIIVLVVLTSGIGGSVPQMPDHLYRNTLYKVLVDYDWPVKITAYTGSVNGLTYYIGFWLPAALCAKFTSYQFGFLFQQIWAVIGLFLVWYFICERKKKLSILFLVLFFLFGGADYIGTLLTGNYFDQPGNSVEWYSVLYNYPSVLTEIFWAFNQAIYAWVIFVLLQRQTTNRSLLFIWSASLLSCTLPAVGMIPFVVYQGFQNTEGDTLLERLTKGIKASLTAQNAIGFLVALLFSIYLLSNISFSANMAQSLEGINRSLVVENQAVSTVVAGSFKPYRWTSTLYSYLWFILIEFGLWYMVIYKSQHNKGIYWLTFVVLLVCPLIKIGYFIDFCMRASIPALFVLYEMVLDAIDDYIEKADKIRLGMIVVLFLIAGVNCYETLVAVIQPMTENLYFEKENVLELIEEPLFATAENFFASENTFFFRYIGK